MAHAKKILNRLMTLSLFVSVGFAALLYGASPAWAATAPSLGSAESFGVLGGSTVTNTGDSVINGDVGVSPGTSITGFPPGIIVNGMKHAGDTVAQQAQSDVTTAYNALVSQDCNSDLTGQDLGGLTLTPNVYCFVESSAQLTGKLTLNAQGNSNAVFVFQIGSTLTTASSSSVVFTDGLESCNVFWQVGTSATLGTGTQFVGNILALTSITLNTGAIVSGKILARNGAVTLNTNTLAVTLASFYAAWETDRVRVAWETASELDNAGFHVWRADTETGNYDRITHGLIPAEGGPTLGAMYTYEDSGVEPGRTYYYKLEDIDYSGQSTFHGPVSACVGIVDIKANVSDGPVVVSPDTPVSVSVGLNPGEYEGQTSDLWIAANTPFAPPFDWYTYVYPTGWEPGIRPCAQTPLFDLAPPVEILNMPLPLGNYIFYFGADDPDGMAAGPWLGLDSVEVEVR